MCTSSYLVQPLVNPPPYVRYVPLETKCIYPFLFLPVML